MARRDRARHAESLAAEGLPAASVDQRPEAVAVRQPREIVIRAGHEHRGVRYDGEMRYVAMPEEIDLLERYNAIVED